MKNIIIYGAGTIGLSLYKVAKEKGYNILYFLDIYKTGKIDDTYIIHPDKTKHLRTEAPIFLTIIDFLEETRVVNYLNLLNKNLKIKKFSQMLMAFPEIISEKYKENFFWLGGKECFDAKYLNIVEFFKDKKSRQNFEDWIKFRETLNPKYYVEPEVGQYMPKDINWLNCLKNDCITFFDIGAYDGNTYEFFLKKFNEAHKNIKIYFAFEPEKLNFAKLKRNIKKISKKYPKTRVVLLPLGVWNKNALLSIISKGAASKTVVAFTRVKESTFVPVVKLDDMFLNMCPDIIKIDIEGAEKEAIYGAKNIIREHSPVLLISLYHKPKDLWEIPVIINEINPNYDMHIRVHSHLFIETVLYCIPRSR